MHVITRVRCCICRSPLMDENICKCIIHRRKRCSMDIKNDELIKKLPQLIKEYSTKYSLSLDIVKDIILNEISNFSISNTSFDQQSLFFLLFNN